MKPRIRQITPELIELKWDSTINDVLLQQQLAFKSQLKENFEGKIVEIRQGFDSLGIRVTHSSVSVAIRQFISDFTDLEVLPRLATKIWNIPVCYSLETGRDLHKLAEAKNISADDLISLHSSSNYRIHFFGFLPGFMYLHGLSELLFAPRKKNPDLIVPRGSVAIGGNQTGIYPSESPGGWHLIGQSPSLLFSPDLQPPVFATPGEMVRFSPISKLEFDRLIRHPKAPAFQC